MPSTYLKSIINNMYKSILSIGNFRYSRLTCAQSCVRCGCHCRLCCWCCRCCCYYYLSKSNFSFYVIYANAKSQLIRCSTLNSYWQPICATSFKCYINFAYEKLSTHHCHRTITIGFVVIVVIVIMNATKRKNHKRKKILYWEIVGNLLAHVYYKFLI